MVDKEDRLAVLWILTAVIILFEIYYWYPVYTGQYEHIDLVFTFSRLAVLFWSSLVLDIVLLYAITFGFYRRKNWARLYTILYFSYSGFWALVMMFIVRWKVYERYVFFIFYVLVIMYLLLSHVKEYFGKTSETRMSSFAESHVYRYGDYTLFKQEKKLKNGGTQPSYFFSKKISDRGEPCGKPDDYAVGINKKTGMPYLKKKK